MLIKMIPFVFVILWSSGFVGARLGVEYAEPATLLSLRMVANVALFLVLIAILKRRIPRGRAFFHACVVGILIHGFYLGGTYLAIDMGMPAGLSSLLVGLQPILTALIMISCSSQRFNFAQWLGLALGFAGISLVLMGNIEWQSDAQKGLATLLCLVSFLKVFSFTGCALCFQILNFKAAILYFIFPFLGSNFSSFFNSLKLINK